MAPAVLPHAPTVEHIHEISRSVLDSLLFRPPSNQPAALFASVLHHAGDTASASLNQLPREGGALSIFKRQENGILAIPTTYSGLNSGPAPGAVVGIVLGSVAGFLLALFIVFSVWRLSGRWGGGRVVEEEIITRRRSRSRSSRSESEVIEVQRPPRRERRRRTQEETIVVEEIASEPEDDIVEVIEEHSPERRPSTKSKRPSGFRVVDPAEPGGGSRPMRKISKR